MSTQTSRTKLDHAMALVGAGRTAEAKAALLRLVQQSPRDQKLLATLVAALCALGEFDTALYYADRAVEVSGGSAGARANRARVHVLARRLDQASVDLRAVLAAEPGNMEARLALTQVLDATGHLDEALALLDEVGDQLEESNRLTEARAKVLLGMGRADEALMIQKRQIPRDPANPAVAERAASAAIYALHSTAAELKELSARFGRLVSVRMPVARHPFTNTPDPERRLRIGFLSGDFRGHASMRFFEPLAFSYDKQRMDVRCYMTISGEDSYTARVRSAVDRFEFVDKLRIPDLAAKIRADQLDIAVDLAGRTLGHRLECFHHRLAPVQLSWYGQPCTTGLTAFDYRIVDSYTDPAGTEANNVERLLRLDPCGFAFAPVPGTPDVQPPPSQRADSPTRGRITFGSFNNLTKMNDETFVLWARVLGAVPGSTLVLRHLAFASPGVCADVLRRFAAAGLGADAHARVRILGPVNGSEALMPEYHSIDITLDTFPYSGMTTTCEALTMGVPVVSLAMERSVSRHSLSILVNCGLEDLVAYTPDDYLRIAVGLANDPTRLAEIRSTARARFARIVGDGAGLARRFEAGIRSVWREWCLANPSAV